MVLSEIEAHIYSRLRYPGTPETTVITRLRRFVNSAYREVLASKGFGMLRRGVLPFTTVADSPFAVLPQVASQVYAIVDRANNRPLHRIDIDRARLYDPGLTFTTSTPEAYAIYEMHGYLAQLPSAAAQLFVKSDNAGDTQISYLESVLTGGVSSTATKTLTGTTAVAFDPTTVIDVRKFYLASVAVGNVTLHEGSGAGTELARIPAGRSRPRYTSLLIYPTPASAVTLYADIELRLIDLANANEEPIFDEDYDWLLVEGALAREWLDREQFGKYDRAMGRFNRGVSEFRLRLAKLGMATTPYQHRWSQLGPWYPAGS